LTGAATDTRIIVESFLQANLRIRSRYKCCAMHSCVRENKLTHDSYYIVKHIIFQVLRTVPSLRNLIMLQNHDYFSELLTPKSNAKLQSESADLLFVKFCKILCKIKLDFNIAIFVTGVENLFEQSDLQNFIYLLRAASLYFPPYLKFVLTAEKRESKERIFDKTIKILQNVKIVDV